MTRLLTRETTEAPAAAFRFALPVQFADAAGGQVENEHRVTVQARTPGVVNHWYWGRMVHDMSGCRHKDKLPMDYRHDIDGIIGYFDAITADNSGLSASGLIQSLDANDRANEIIRRGRKGQPYEASIYWDENNHVLEWLDEGWVAEVNGQQVEGPLVIAREWTLRGIAITPYGVDPTTNTQFSAERSVTVPVRLNQAKDAMSKAPTSAPAGEQNPTKDSAPVTQLTGSQTQQPSQVTPPIDATRDAARGELSRYMQRFGTERGAEYFRDSVPYEQACEKEIEHLRASLATKDSELSAERAKLASLSLGEQSPVDTGKTKDSQGKAGWSSLFKKAGS